MKLLITGAEGVLGSALVRVAKEMGYSVMALDRAELDITDLGRARALIAKTRAEVVINCAAFSNVDAAQKFPQEALKVNRDGARTLAAAAAEIGAKIVYLSTDYVFDGKKTSPYLPGDQTAPLNLYGISKLAGEQAVREVAPQALILRTSWLFGDGGRGVRSLGPEGALGTRWTASHSPGRTKPAHMEPGPGPRHPGAGRSRRHRMPSPSQYRRLHPFGIG